MSTRYPSGSQNDQPDDRPAPLLDHGSEEIAILLPPGEGFSAKSAGALALFVHETALNSRFSGAITVYGRPVDQPFKTAHFHPLSTDTRWFQSRSKQYIKRFIKALKERDNLPSLIEIQNRPRYLPWIKQPYTDIPILLSLHNDPRSMKGMKTARECRESLARCETVTCCSDYMRDKLCLAVDPALQKRVFTVYHGVQIHPLKEKTPTILFAGRLVEEKGVIELAEACRDLLPHHPDWSLLIAGSESHGSKAGVSHFARRLYRILRKLGRQAVMTGFISHKKLISLMAEAAIVVVPSKWEEPFGRVAAEALSTGSILVTSGKGGLKEIAGKSGIILPEVSAAAIKETLKEIIEMPEQQRKKLQKKCHDRAQKFSLADISRQLDSVREKALSGKMR